MVTHDVASANTYADKAISINKGIITETAIKKRFQIESKNSLSDNNGSLQFTRTSLSPKATWKIVSKSFKNRAIRLVLSAILCVFCFTLMLSFFKYIMWTPYNPETKLLNYENASVLSRIEHVKSTDDNGQLILQKKILSLINPI